MEKNIKDYLHLEEWRDLERFPKNQVSNLGRIRVKKTGRVIEQRLREDGYFDVRLWHNVGLFKTVKVHRLVAVAFLDGYQPEFTVNHLDFNKQNNFADNLEWCSLRDNIKHAVRAGQRNDYGGKRFPIDKAQVLAKKKILLNESTVFDSVSEVAAHLGVKQSTISQALRRGNKVLKTNTVQYAD